MSTALEPVPRRLLAYCITEDEMLAYLSAPPDPEYVRLIRFDMPERARLLYVRHDPMARQFDFVCEHPDFPETLNRCEIERDNDSRVEYIALQRAEPALAAENERLREENNELRRKVEQMGSTLRATRLLLAETSPP